MDLPVEMVGPSIAEHNGKFYLSGNGGVGMWKSSGPLGPWKRIGDILDHNGEKIFWADLMFFVDDDGSFYCYHHSGSGRGTDGIFVTLLDPASDFTRAAGPTRNCFAYEPSHIWERWGDRNEHPNIAWIESPWLTKHNGQYYLQYSGAGTEWKTYAVGVYVSDSALGPFRYQETSPILKDQGGLLNGTGHHAMVTGPDGRLWCLYHVLFRNRDKFDRRLALDPVGFDTEGRMFIDGPSEVLRFIPLSTPTSAKPVGKMGKIVSQNKPATASGSLPGRPALYAVDNNIRTWWQAADNTFPQWMSVDLMEPFGLIALRVIFAEASGNHDPESADKSWDFRIETSPDGKQWTSGEPRSSESDIYFTELDGSAARHVRIRIERTPGGIPAGITDLCVFAD
jgi:hypothetical protein